MTKPPPTSAYQMSKHIAFGHTQLTLELAYKTHLSSVMVPTNFGLIANRNQTIGEPDKRVSYSTVNTLGELPKKNLIQLIIRFDEAVSQSTCRLFRSVS